MRSFELALIEWPEGQDVGGPRVLGRVTDSDVISHVRELIAARRRQELARLQSPVRLVRGEELQDPEDPVS